MITIDSQDAALFELTFAGQLTREDYDVVMPVLEKAIAEHGKLRLLARFDQLESVSPGAMLADLHWDWKHRHDVEKCAAVVHGKWMELGTKAVALIYSGEVKTFEPEQLDQARQWLRT